MKQSKFGSYYDSTKNARPYTNSYGGSNQNLDAYDEYDNDYDEQEEDDDHVYASDDYDEENLEEEDNYYGRYTDGRETGSYNNYGRFHEQRNNFGYGNYSGRGDYGYRDQQTLPRYNSGIFSGYGRSDHSGIRDGYDFNESNDRARSRRRRSDYSY